MSEIYTAGLLRNTLSVGMGFNLTVNNIHCVMYVVEQTHGIMISNMPKKDKI